MTLQQVRQIANEFLDGEPVSEEVRFSGQGVVFHFDNPFEDDVEEFNEGYPLPASIMIDRDVHSEFDPHTEEVLDCEAGDLVEDICRTLESAGFNVSWPEFDEANSTNSFWEFHVSLSL